MCNFEEDQKFSCGGGQLVSYYGGIERENNLKIVTPDEDRCDSQRMLGTEVAAKCVRCVLVCIYAFLCSSFRLGVAFPLLT